MARNFGLTNQTPPAGDLGLLPRQPTTSWDATTPVLSHEGFFFNEPPIELDQDMPADREFAAFWFALACFFSPIVIGGVFLFGLFVVF